MIWWFSTSATVVAGVDLVAGFDEGRLVEPDGGGLVQPLAIGASSASP